MPCFHPLTAYQDSSGQISFHQRGTEGKSLSGAAYQKARYGFEGIARQLQLPCGQCIGCRLERRRQWMVRMLQESKMHNHSCFITLTVNEENYPVHGYLPYAMWQNFMRRVRYEFTPQKVRFFMASEYGERLVNPHFHAILYGIDFQDRYYWKKGSADSKLYRSPTLERLWPFGFSTIGNVTPQSCGYIAGYCIKKINGDLAKEHYRRVDPVTGEIYQLPPEFCQMSRKPGIGSGFLEKYMSDVYPHGYVVVDGRKQKPPRYYDKAFEKLDALGFEAIAYDRFVRAKALAADNTDERLLVREQVETAKSEFYSGGRA